MEGETQGDPEAAAFFCIGIQPYVKELCSTVQDAGGTAKFGCDDGMVVGPDEVVFPAVLEFEKQVKEKCNLFLQRSKSQVFTWDGTLPEGSPDGMVLAGEEVDGVFHGGFLCHGVPIGTDHYVQYMLSKKVDQVVASAERAVRGEAVSMVSVEMVNFPAVSCATLLT